MTISQLNTSGPRTVDLAVSTPAPGGGPRRIQNIDSVISSAAQRAAAAEILSRVREEVATRNAMSMRGA